MRKTKHTIPRSEVTPELLLKVIRELLPGYATDEDVFQLLVWGWGKLHGKQVIPEEKTRKILMEIARVKANGHAKYVISRAVRDCYHITRDSPEFKRLCHSATMACKRYPQTLAALVKVCQGLKVTSPLPHR